MVLDVFAKGVAAGLVIAAPVGPVGVLCVHRTLVHGRIHGLLSGLGAALADAAFGAAAAFGLTFVAQFLAAHHDWIRLGGGALLLVLAARTFLAPGPNPDDENQARSLGGDCASAFALTATNPMTVLSFLGIFAALGIATAGLGLREASVLVLGVFLGSALWWILLSAGVGVFRRAMEVVYLRWIQLVSGALLLGFGIGVLGSLML
jgi:threonine/homoserine/homoserine lactone efflux protein